MRFCILVIVAATDVPNASHGLFVRARVFFWFASPRIFVVVGRFSSMTTHCKKHFAHTDRRNREKQTTAQILW